MMVFSPQDVGKLMHITGLDVGIGRRAVWKLWRFILFLGVAHVQERHRLRAAPTRVISQAVNGFQVITSPFVKPGAAFLLPPELPWNYPINVGIDMLADVERWGGAHAEV